jgi:hypothetical protein
MHSYVNFIIDVILTKYKKKNRIFFTIKTEKLEIIKNIDN